MNDLAAFLGVGVVRIEFENLLEVGQGAFVVLEDVEDVAAVGVGGDVLRVEADGLGVVGHRLVDFVLLAMGQAAVVVDFGIARIELQRLVVFGDGLGKVAVFVRLRPRCEWVWASAFACCNNPSSRSTAFARVSLSSAFSQAL